MHRATQKLVPSTRLVAMPHTCLWIAVNDPSKSRQLQWKRHKELTTTRVHQQNTTELCTSKSRVPFSFFNIYYVKYISPKLVSLHLSRS